MTEPAFPTERRRVLGSWASTHAAYGATLARTDSSWGTQVFDLAGGVAVLHGRGLYVNRACAAGIERPMIDDDVDLLERRSTEVGVAPAVEVTPLTHPDTVDRLRSRGYAADDVEQAFAIGLSADREFAPVDHWLAIESIDASRVGEWQEAAAIGWGHVEPDRRRASDAFVVAAAAVDRPGLMLAVERSSGRAVGCATLNIVDDIATLGGMSTVPEARGRGVQSALIRHRLTIAADAGCSIAVSTADPEGASARNLLRHGFTSWFPIATWEPTS